MTIKEISDFTGKEIRTIRRWIAKAGDKVSQVPHDKMSQGIPFDYSIDDVECILQSGSMSKDAVTIVMSNARNNNKTSDTLADNTSGGDIVVYNAHNQTELFLRFFDKIQKDNLNAIDRMQKDNQIFMQNIIAEIRLQNATQSKPNNQLQIEDIPEKPLREAYKEKMREYAFKSGKDFGTAYRYVYDEIGSIYGIRVMARAKNRKCTGVDILESDGYLNKGISVIIKLIKTLEEGV